MHSRSASAYLRPMLISLTVLTWLALPTAALADPDEHHPDFAKHALWSLLYHQKDMGLSAEQVEKLKEIQINYAKAHVKAEADTKLAKIDAMALKMDEKSDLGAIEAAMQKHERAETAMHLESVKAIRAAMALLSAEQRDAWKAHMMKLGKRLHERTH